MKKEKEKRATFTPGPWTFTLADENCAGGVYGGGKCVCDIIPKELAVAWDCEEISIANANARLIAAAPEMYEVLQEILAPCPVKGYLGKYDRRRTYNARKKAREVLAKVDGRVEG